MKPVHARPSLYAYYFEVLKEIARDYGYNLVLHGSLNRDLDLIAIPWGTKVLPHEPMISDFARVLGGRVQHQSEADKQAFAQHFHGRVNYIINLNREMGFRVTDGRALGYYTQSKGGFKEYRKCYRSGDQGSF